MSEFAPSADVILKSLAWTESIDAREDHLHTSETGETFLLAELWLNGSPYRLKNRKTGEIYTPHQKVPANRQSLASYVYVDQLESGDHVFRGDLLAEPDDEEELNAMLTAMGLPTVEEPEDRIDADARRVVYRWFDDLYGRKSPLAQDFWEFFDSIHLKERDAAFKNRFRSLVNAFQLEKHWDDADRAFAEKFLRRGLGAYDHKVPHETGGGQTLAGWLFAVIAFRAALLLTEDQPVHQRVLHSLIRQVQSLETFTNRRLTHVLAEDGHVENLGMVTLLRLMGMVMFPETIGRGFGVSKDISDLIGDAPELLRLELALRGKRRETFFCSDTEIRRLHELFTTEGPYLRGCDKLYEYDTALLRLSTGASERTIRLFWHLPSSRQTSVPLGGNYLSSFALRYVDDFPSRLDTETVGDVDGVDLVFKYHRELASFSPGNLRAIIGKIDVHDDQHEDQLREQREERFRNLFANAYFDAQRVKRRVQSALVSPIDPTQIPLQHFIEVLFSTTIVNTIGQELLDFDNKVVSTESMFRATNDGQHRLLEFFGLLSPKATRQWTEEFIDRHGFLYAPFGQVWATLTHNLFRQALPLVGGRLGGSPVSMGPRRDYLTTPTPVHSQTLARWLSESEGLTPAHVLSTAPATLPLDGPSVLERWAREFPDLTDPIARQRICLTSRLAMKLLSSHETRLPVRVLDEDGLRPVDNNSWLEWQKGENALVQEVYHEEGGFHVTLLALRGEHTKRLYNLSLDFSFDQDRRRWEVLLTPNVYEVGMTDLREYTYIQENGLFDKSCFVIRQVMTLLRHLFSDVAEPMVLSVARGEHLYVTTGEDPVVLTEESADRVLDNLKNNKMLLPALASQASGIPIYRYACTFPVVHPTRKIL